MSRKHNNTDEPPQGCFLCDETKNKRCKKEHCHINGGDCYYTTNYVYARTSRRGSSGKSVVVESPEGGVKKYSSAKVAAEAYNLTYAKVIYAIKSKTELLGMKWKYEG